MNKIKIITDSTSDLSKQIRDEYGIDYCCMGFSLGETDYKASLDWEDFSFHDYYEKMRSGSLFKTIQVTTKQFLETFTKYLQEGMDIVYIGCSSALSGSVASAEMLARELRREYKGQQILCVDSLISGMGQGMMVIEAAKMRDEGKSAEEIAQYLEESKMYCDQVGTVESLEYLKKAGRVSASSAFFGNLFAVKPILISDKTGQNLAVKKVKGRKSSLEETAEQVRKYIDPSVEQTVYISHADDEQAALRVESMIREKVPGVPTELAKIGPIVGASVGPGTIIVYFHGASKEEHMKQER